MSFAGLASPTRACPCRAPSMCRKLLIFQIVEGVIISVSPQSSIHSVKIGSLLRSARAAEAQMTTDLALSEELHLRARKGEPRADRPLINWDFDGTVLAAVISTTVYGLADTVDEVALETTGSCVRREAE